MATKKTTIKKSKRTITKTVEANVYEVPLSDILKHGSVTYEDHDDADICLAVGDGCEDDFVGVIVDGKAVDPKNVIIIFAEDPDAEGGWM